MLSCDLRRIVAVALVFLTAFMTMPVSAADFTTKKSVIGSVSAVGPVELRGVGISQEGTLFQGDSIRAGQKGYAKLLLGTSKVELSERTEVNINRDAQGVKIAMNTGTVGFTAPTPLRIDVLPFEVIATDGASGRVAIMGSNVAGVRAINGNITVRNLKTLESFVVAKGQERLLGLQNGLHAPAIAQIASNAPGPIPAPRVPQAPAGRTTGGLAMDTGAWLAVIGGAAVAGVAIWGLVVALGNNDDIDDLKSTINNLNNTNTANAAAIKNLANAQNISITVSQLQAQQNQAAALAAQAQIALTLAGNAGAAAQAANLAAQANALQNQLSALQSQIQAAQARIAAGTGSAADVTALLTQEEALRAQANNIANQLNALLTANRNTPGVPSSSVATVGGPSQASASLPV
jgi:hypothetical protein